jgi:hypothetical protein
MEERAHDELSQDELYNQAGTLQAREERVSRSPDRRKRARQKPYLAIGNGVKSRALERRPCGRIACKFARTICLASFRTARRRKLRHDSQSRGDALRLTNGAVKGSRIKMSFQHPENLSVTASRVVPTGH